MRAQLAKSKRMVESEVSAIADITKEREEASHIDCSPESNLEEINVDAPTRNQPSQTSQVLNVKQEEGKAEVKIDTSPDCRVSQPVPPIPSLVIISVGAPTVVSKTEYPLHSTISLLEDLRSTRRELDKHSQLTFQPSSSSSNRHNGIRFDDRRSNAQGDASKRYGREMSVDSTTLYSIARGDYFNTKVHSEPIVVPQRAYSDTYRSSLSYTPEPSHNKLGGHPSLPVPHVNPSTLPPSMSYYSHLLRPSHFSAPLPLGNNLQSEKAGRRREYLARLHEVQ